MINAPFFDKQPKDGISEIFCLIGAESWKALGYNKQEKRAYGEEWQLLTQSTGADFKRLPLVLGKPQLNELHRLKFTDTQKMIRFCVFGELSETQKTVLLKNIAQNSPLETVIFADNLGNTTENASDYIQRLRTEKSDLEYVQKIAEQYAENAPKRTPYIESREAEPISGLFYVKPQLDKQTGEITGEKTDWICNDLELAGKGKDHQGEYYYLFKWQNSDEKAPRLEAVHFADFGTETGWKQLKGKGLQMTQSAGLTGKLAEHYHAISHKMPSNWKITDLAGWQNGAYILPNGETIGDFKSPVFFTKKTMDNLGYYTKGTIESWRSEIADNLRGNHSMILGVAVAFSAPMLAILGLSSFGVHLYAESSKGKSTTLHLANSIYGESKHLMKTWNSTAYAIQQEAEARNDGFITLDEIGQAKDGKSLETIAYDLFNETGKMQGKKEGGNRKVNRWKISALSTGEKDLETQLAMQGAKVHAGQLVRLLNLPLDETNCFHSFPNAKAHADHLNEAVQNHFGTVGREWIEFLAENGETVKNTYKAIRRKWLDLTERMSGQVQRVAGDRFAVLETALQLAKDWTGWTEEENANAIMKNFLNWKELFGETTREETKIIETLIDWINENEASFIEYPHNPEQRTPIKVLGYRVLADDKPVSKSNEYYFIARNAFRDCLSEFTTNTACTILHNMGILEKGKNGEFPQYVPKQITGNKSVRAYKIIPIFAETQDG